MPYSNRRTLWLIIAALSTLLIVSIYLLIHQNGERNRVVSVTDGDSFKTHDDRRIRLLGIDAPEDGRCLSQEAKNKLSGLILNKRVKLTDITHDSYGRILANVFVKENSLPGAREIFVNKIMLEEGLAKFLYVTSPYYQELKNSAHKTKEAQIGIYSNRCRSSTPPTENCSIKGNTNTEGVKIYYLPGCQHYNEVIVDEAFGDYWFCSEKDASDLGFKKAENCE